MWEERQGPWENSVWAGSGGGIFKSVDGGTTWKPLTNGLPVVVQANVAISPANPKRLYAAVAGYDKPGTGSDRGAAGIYRSDDAGETWARITTDTRPAGRIGGGDLPMPIAHPKDPDIVIMASTVSWKSTDGGKTWASFKGAPGGEDYQNGWINPDNPDIILLAADQGAVVTLNGGETWSSWYNQPTGQFYHVSADNAFPYRVCSGQQENGSVCVSSRGNYGAISDRDWLPVSVDEYGFVAPDPLDPDIVYGGRTVTRFDRRTGQVSVVGPVGGRGGVGGAPGTFRQVRTMPVIFSEVDKRALFFANNHLWKTIDGGAHWKQLSPDLTRQTWTVPASVGKYASDASAQPAPRGVIYTVAPSYQDINRIWVGTDDGLIHVTADNGVTWKDVTPPAVGPWAKVSVMDAGRFSPLTAYAAINTLRLDDLQPAHLPHARRRQDVDRDRHRHSERRDGERGSRGSQTEGTALCRHRARGLRVVRRRGELAVAAAEHGGVVGARPDRQGRRPRGGDARPRVLDSRRHHAAASDGRGLSRSGRDPVQADDRMAGAGGTRAWTCRGRRRSRRRRILQRARSSTTT